MQTGYLALQTHAEHPGMVRLLQTELLPDTATRSDGASIRFVVRFADVDAARMHFHNRLRRRLVDVDERLYRASVVDAITALDAIDMRHWPVYTAPDVDDVQRAAIGGRVQRLRRRALWRERLYQALGILALLYLFLHGLLI